MPCNADYLEPTNREKQLQHAANLLVYLYKKLGITPLDWVAAEANNIYASDERSVVQLCATLKALEPSVRDWVVYNARNKTARQLADWWEEHQAADAERERQALGYTEKP